MYRFKSCNCDFVRLSFAKAIFCLTNFNRLSCQILSDSFWISLTTYIRIYVAIYYILYLSV